MQKTLLHDEIPVAIMWSKNLTDKDKLVMGEIYTMINQGKPFIMSNQKLADRLNCSSRTISKSVSHLVQTNWIKTRTVKSATGSTEFREVYGINLLRALKFSSISHRRISLGGHEDNFHQINHANKSINRSVNNLPQQKAEKELADIDELVQQKWTIGIPCKDKMLIDNLIYKFGYQSVKNAVIKTADNGIGINGMPNYVKAIVISNAHKPKRKPNDHYGHRPIKEHVPDWAKDGYKPKLHRTSPKLQAKVRKQLRDLGYGKKNKK